jgi:pimeloyl-ACP methyl ester carboxylesterase
MQNVRYQKTDVDGFGIFYREAGQKPVETLLLLHGVSELQSYVPWPHSATRGSIPRYRTDLPGFGQSDMPNRDTFAYTFENIARVIDRFT